MYFLFLLLQNDPESCALAGLGILYKDIPLVKLLNDAFGKAEAKAPTPLFGGKPGLEHLVDVL